MKDKLILIFMIMFGVTLLTCCATTTPSVGNERPLVLTVPEHYEKVNQPDWNSINDQIRHSNARVIILNWQGYGGYTYIGDQTISAIKYAKSHGKTIIIRLTGEAISMHANVACYASSIDWNTGDLIFHSEFTRDARDGHKIYSNDASYFYDCKAVGILTQEGIHHIIDLRQMVVKDHNSSTYREDQK